jgi:hypothetical protein
MFCITHIVINMALNTKKQTKIPQSKQRPQDRKPLKKPKSFVQGETDRSPTDTQPIQTSIGTLLSWLVLRDVSLSQTLTYACQVGGLIKADRLIQPALRLLAAVPGLSCSFFFGLMPLIALASLWWCFENSYMHIIYHVFS